MLKINKLAMHSTFAICMLLTTSLTACAMPLDPPVRPSDEKPADVPASQPAEESHPLVFLEDKIRKTKITLGEGELAEEFKLEIADDIFKRADGLAGRADLDDDGGMIFIYPTAEHRGFWMKDCVMDLEIIFLDEIGRITAMHEMKAQPLQRPRESMRSYNARLRHYRSRRPAQFAIEVKPGTLERLKIRVGDTIEADWTALAELAE